MVGSSVGSDVSGDLPLPLPFSWLGDKWPIASIWSKAAVRSSAAWLISALILKMRSNNRGGRCG